MPYWSQKSLKSDIEFYQKPRLFSSNQVISQNKPNFIHFKVKILSFQKSLHSVQENMKFQLIPLNSHSVCRSTCEIFSYHSLLNHMCLIKARNEIQDKIPLRIIPSLSNVLVNISYFSKLQETIQFYILENPYQWNTNGA